MSNLRDLYRLLLKEAAKDGLVDALGGKAVLKAEVCRAASQRVADMDGEIEWDEACCDALEELVDEYASTQEYEVDEYDEPNHFPFEF